MSAPALPADARSSSPFERYGLRVEEVPRGGARPAEAAPGAARHPRGVDLTPSDWLVMGAVGGLFLAYMALLGFIAHWTLSWLVGA